MFRIKVSLLKIFYYETLLFKILLYNLTWSRRESRMLCKYIEIRERIAIVWRRVRLTKNDSYYCDEETAVQFAWNFLFVLSPFLPHLIGLDRPKVKKKKEKKKSLRFYGLQRRGRRFQSGCTTRLNRPNQISVHAMSVKFNSRSISAFGSRPSIIPSFIASSQVIRRDVEVLFKKKGQRKREAGNLLRAITTSKILQTIKRYTLF